MPDGDRFRIGPLRALKHRFEVTTSSEVLAGWLEAAFRPLTGEGPVDVSYAVIERNPDEFVLTADGRRVGGPGPARSILPVLLSRLNDMAAESLTDHLVLHAAVAADGKGAVLLPGRSGAGKSTLVALLSRRGHRYGGDEHAAISLEDLRVQPYPKPVAIKRGSAALFGGDEPPPGSGLVRFFEDQLILVPTRLGSGVLEEPVRVSSVVLPQFVADAPVELGDVGAARAVVLLREQCFNFRLAPDRSFAALVALARRVPVQRLRYGDAREAVTVLARHIA